MNRKKKKAALDKVQARLHPDTPSQSEPESLKEKISKATKAIRRKNVGSVTYGVKQPETESNSPSASSSAPVIAPDDDVIIEAGTPSPTSPSSEALNNAPPRFNPDADALFEQQLEISEDSKQKKEKLRVKRYRQFHTASMVAIVCACVYMIFLIYGVCTTAYIYNDHGQVVPQILSVEEIRDLKEFEKVSAEYLQTRSLYERVLLLDYRVGAGNEDPMLIAPEYEALLSDIEALSIQIQALNPSAKYTQLVNMMALWVTNDIAIYCQRMSTAISTNNSEHAAQSLEYKTITYNDFGYITSALITMGGDVTGADITAICEWSPEKYIQHAVGIQSNIN